MVNKFDGRSIYKQLTETDYLILARKLLAFLTIWRKKSSLLLEPGKLSALL